MRSGLRPVLSLLVLGAGCASATVRVPLVRPAEINLAQYKTLGLGSLGNGPAAMSISASLEEELLRQHRFAIVDRQRVESVMNELKLATSDLSDPRNSIKLGSLVTAGALLSGNVEERYTENPREQYFSGSDGNQYVHRYSDARLAIEADFRVIDVSTGTLLFAKRISVERTQGPAGGGAQVAAALFGAIVSQLAASAQDVNDPPPDRGAMEREARREVVRRLVKALEPTTELVEVRFATDGDLPQLETGVGFARHGDWPRAQQTFNTAIEDAEKSTKIGASTLSKAYFDAALSYEYAGDYDKAQPLLDRAAQLSGNAAPVQAEQENLGRLRADARRLAEQAQVGAQ